MGKKQKVKYIIGSVLLVSLVLVTMFLLTASYLNAAAPGEKICPADQPFFRDGRCTKCPPGQGSYDAQGKPISQPDAKGECQLINPAPGQLVPISDLGELLAKLINILLYFAGTIAVIFLVVGGFRYVTSVGNEEALEKAKKTITGAVIGIVIIVMAFAIVTIINNLLTKGPGAQPPSPAQQQQSGQQPPSQQQPPPSQGQVSIAINGNTIYGEEEIVQISFTATPTGTYTWSLEGTLPSGVDFNPSIAQIIGPAGPGTGGTYNLTISASKTGQKVGSKSFSLIIQTSGTPSPGATNTLSFTPLAASFSCQVNTDCELIVGTIQGGKLPYSFPVKGQGITYADITADGQLKIGVKFTSSENKTIRLQVRDSTTPTAQRVDVNVPVAVP